MIESMSETAPSKASIFSALIAVQVLFGINYVATKIVVSVFPPLVWASIRIVVSTILMAFLASSLRRPHPKPDREFFIPLIVYALLGMVINQGSFLVGLHYTTATNSAILNTLIPVFTLFIVTLRGQEPLTRTRGLGFFLSLTGVLVLRRVETITFSDKTLLGDLLTILNCVSYALFLSFTKKFLQKYDRAWTTTWLFLYGSVGLTLLATPDWIGFHMPELTPVLLGSMAFAILGGTLLTYFLNIWTLAHAKPSSVALFIYVQPIIASLLAWFWLDQPITLRTVMASLLIFAGMLLAMNQRSRPHCS